MLLWIFYHFTKYTLDTTLSLRLMFHIIPYIWYHDNIWYLIFDSSSLLCYIVTAAANHTMSLYFITCHFNLPFTSNYSCNNCSYLLFYFIIFLGIFIFVNLSYLHLCLSLDPFSLCCCNTPISPLGINKGLPYLILP